MWLYRIIGAILYMWLPRVIGAILYTDIHRDMVASGK